jgi:hypothetical protein
MFPVRVHHKRKTRSGQTTSQLLARHEQRQKKNKEYNGQTTADLIALMRAIRRESDSSERFFISSACGFDIYKLLGDVSSIKSLTDSNHTLQHVRLQASHFISTTGRISLDRVSLDLPPFAKKCLELNRIDNKLRVIRNKITQLYFVGDFDVTPFRHMPISVLPEVISQIKCSTQQSAIFRLLVSVPELFIPFKRGLAKQTKPPISLI